MRTSDRGRGSANGSSGFGGSNHRFRRSHRRPSRRAEDGMMRDKSGYDLRDSWRSRRVPSKVHEVALANPFAFVGAKIMCLLNELNE